MWRGHRMGIWWCRRGMRCGCGWHGEGGIGVFWVRRSIGYASDCKGLDGESRFICTTVVLLPKMGNVRFFCFLVYGWGDVGERLSEPVTAFWASTDGGFGLGRRRFVRLGAVRTGERSVLLVVMVIDGDVVRLNSINC